MAYYTALITEWATITTNNPSFTTAQKLAAVNALTIASPKPAVFPPSEILNACVAADLETLTVTQIALLQLLLAGTSVDASNGTAIRAVCQNIFAGKASLTSLATLVSSYDNATIPWWRATVVQGGGGLSSPVSMADLAVNNLT